MNLLQKLVCHKVEIDTTPYVQIVDTDSRAPRCAGNILSINLKDKSVTILVQYGIDNIERVVKMSNIVTINRMRDGRLRMWIKGGLE